MVSIIGMVCALIAVVFSGFVYVFSDMHAERVLAAGMGFICTIAFAVHLSIFLGV